MRNRGAIAAASITIGGLLLLAAVTEAVPFSAAPISNAETSAANSNACRNSEYAQIGVFGGFSALVGAVAYLLGLSFWPAFLITLGLGVALDNSPVQNVLDKNYGCDKHQMQLDRIRDAQSKGTLEQLEAKGAEALNKMDLNGENKGLLIEVIHSTKKTASANSQSLSFDGLENLEGSLNANVMQWLKASVQEATGAIA